MKNLLLLPPEQIYMVFLLGEDEAFSPGSDPYINPSFLHTAKMGKGDICCQHYLPKAASKDTLCRIFKLSFSTIPYFYQFSHHYTTSQ